MSTTILVIEDDADIQVFLRDLLTQQGYVVHVSAKGSEGIQLVEKAVPDVVLLDLTLPDLTGEGVCKQLRQLHPNLPIIILTAKTGTHEKVEVLNLGADDYVTKPFVPEELIARIRARLRQQTTNTGVLSYHGLELDAKRIEVKRDGAIISLTTHEFKLLEYLMSHVGVVLSREMILNHVWAYNFDVESRVVDVYMGYLRKKIDTGYREKLLHSVRGFGYVFKVETD